jgi:hypothetical protein
MPVLSTFSAGSIGALGFKSPVFGGSGVFNSANDYLTVPAGTAFQYGTGDFTIEMWFYPTVANGPAGNGVTLFRQRGSNYYTQRYLFLFLWPTRQVFLQVPGNDFYIGTSNLCNLNEWNHVALVRRSGSMQIFLNGVANTARTNTTNYSDTSAYNLAFGNLVFNTQYTFQGYMTNIRVAKSAYYTTTFDPSRTPFTRTSQGATNVQLLLNFDTDARKNTDSSANNITVTNNSVTYDSFTPFAQPYVIPPAFIPSSVTVTPSTFTSNEGSAITFTIAGTNVTNGTYYYTIEQATGTTAVTAADFTSSSLSGTFTMTSNSGSFSLTPTSDFFTEGDEIFYVAVREGSTSGAILGASDDITITDSSKTPAFTSVPAPATEGSSNIFTVENLGPAGTYYWTVLNGTTTNADFTATSGSFTTSALNQSVSFTVPTDGSRTTEGNETFQVQVRTGSTSGTIILTSTTITLSDTWQTAQVFVSGGATTMNEGSSITMNAQALGPAGNYYWTILHGTTTAADFSASSGMITTSALNGFTNFTITALAGDGAEAAQTFQVEIRTDSTAGPVIATSSTITINANVT